MEEAIEISVKSHMDNMVKTIAKPDTFDDFLRDVNFGIRNSKFDIMNDIMSRTDGCICSIDYDFRKTVWDKSTEAEILILFNVSYFEQSKTYYKKGKGIDWGQLKNITFNINLIVHF